MTGHCSVLQWRNRWDAPLAPHDNRARPFIPLVGDDNTKVKHAHGRIFADLNWVTRDADYGGRWSPLPKKPSWGRHLDATHDHKHFARQSRNMRIAGLWSLTANSSARHTKRVRFHTPLPNETFSNGFADRF